MLSHLAYSKVQKAIRGIYEKKDFSAPTEGNYSNQKVDKMMKLLGPFDGYSEALDAKLPGE